MSLVIIEGCDGSGKTTLVDRARRECSRPFLIIGHAQPQKRNVLETYEATSGVAYAGIHSTVVVDRHPFISDPIYGPILRGKGTLPLVDRIPNLRALISITDRFIYCRPPREVITDNITKTVKNQLSGVMQKHMDIINAYDHVMKEIVHLGGKVYWYDYTFSKMPIEKLLFGNPREQDNATA